MDIFSFFPLLTVVKETSSVSFFGESSDFFFFFTFPSPPHLGMALSLAFFPPSISLPLLSETSPCRMMITKLLLFQIDSTMKKAFGSLSQGTCYLPVFGSDTCFLHHTFFTPDLPCQGAFSLICVRSGNHSASKQTNHFSTDDNVLVNVSTQRIFPFTQQSNSFYVMKFSILFAVSTRVSSSLP